MKKWKHNLPTVNGHSVTIEPEKLTNTLELMWTNQIDPEEVDFILVCEYN